MTARRKRGSGSAHRPHKHKKHAWNGDFVDSDETFAFIAGYTEDGAAFGISWEEMQMSPGGPDPDDDPFGAGVSIHAPVRHPGPGESA